MIEKCDALFGKYSRQTGRARDLEDQRMHCVQNGQSLLGLLNRPLFRHIAMDRNDEPIAVGKSFHFTVTDKKQAKVVNGLVFVITSVVTSIDGKVLRFEINAINLSCDSYLVM